ncbi:thymine dioxygenase [Mycena rebaudengoi]|nr:thymine dioxygenase [Mycena rebaudengoi]
MSSVTLTENQGNAAISVVDFAPFLDGSNKQGVANEILSSFKQVGFVYLLNHGLPQDQIAKMFAVSKEFFAQSTEVKELAPHPPSGTHHRGYSAPGREKIPQPTFIGEGVIRRTVPDVKEHFECGREDDAVRPNIWLPDGILSGMRETCLEFFWLYHEVEMNVLRALAVGFGLSEDYFTQYHGKADNQLRLLHYPSVPAEAIRNERIGRITAHSDYASLTLLLQDDVGGLEIEDPNVAGLFRPAPPIPGALIVNVADFMMRWSNDTIRSTVHRVRAPQGCETPDGMIPERYSIPYVRTQDRETVVDCIPGTWDQENPKKYEPISSGEYTRKRLAAAY